MRRLPEHYTHHAADLWDGYVPSDWLPVRPFEQRTRWDWWRAGVIEGRAFGPGLIMSVLGDPRMARAYNDGVEHAARAMAGAA